MRMKACVKSVSYWLKRLRLRNITKDNNDNNITCKETMIENVVKKLFKLSTSFYFNSHRKRFNHPWEISFDSLSLSSYFAEPGLRRKKNHPKERINLSKITIYQNDAINTIAYPNARNPIQSKSHWGKKQIWINH